MKKLGKVLLQKLMNYVAKATASWESYDKAAVD
jgi:hypothetical protein